MQNFNKVSVLSEQVIIGTSSKKQQYKDRQKQLKTRKFNNSVKSG